LIETEKIIQFKHLLR